MNARAALWPGLLVWVLAAVAMAALDGHVDLANLALVLVLAAALAAVWLPRWAALVVPALAVAGFNLAFVPPRGSWRVDLHQDALLLLTLLAVSWGIALLMTRQRRLAAADRLHAQHAEQRQRLGDTLRDADDPRDAAAALQAVLSSLGGAPAALLLVRDADHAPADDHACLLHGDANADERTGLWLCLTEGRAMGPGTGRHEEQPAWYLPLRGRGASLGAALLRHPATSTPAQVDDAPRRLAQAQALCDQMGLAIERAQAGAAAAAAMAAAQTQQLRNTLLTAISHDYRTPLATIVSAASSLHEQADRLSDAQRRRLAATIVDEAEQLARLTTNALQLARLADRGQPLPMDWESAEEIVGTVVRHARQRQPAQPLELRVEPGLPLLRCDAVLLVQLLDNLVLNACLHGVTPGHDVADVELVVRRLADTVLLAVRDRGPGVALAWRERIFDTFERGEPAYRVAGRHGAGVGLAVCRAIAHAHGGELRHRARAHGGASFECVLPLAAPPGGPVPGASGASP